MGQQSFLIVGGGIVGFGDRPAASRKGASIAGDGGRKQVGRHQTGNNSGVLHAGLCSSNRGWLKARDGGAGIRQMTVLPGKRCATRGLLQASVMRVATAEEELGRLNDLYERGQQNGLTRYALLSKDEIREIEPHAAGIRAVRAVPEEGIVDYAQVCARMVDHINARGGRVVTSALVKALRPVGSELFVAEDTFYHHKVRGGFIINCAGLHSDRVAELGAGRRDMRIVPFARRVLQVAPERRRSTW